MIENDFKIEGADGLGRDRNKNTAEIIVAGHICLDVIPDVGISAANLSPGVLVNAGEVLFATGGAVANTGLALYKLGVNVRLAGKVGDDIFGEAVLKLLSKYDTSLSEFMKASTGENTSYSIIISPPGTDRSFIHSPGCNATFTSQDVSDEALFGTRLLHFGYPPLMEGICKRSGEELRNLFSRARSLDIATSLDMAMPDMTGFAGRVSWPELLGRTLPHVDIFLPSFDELLVMLMSEIPDTLSNKADLESTPDLARYMAEWAINSGAAIVGIKMGDQGFFLQTADADRIRRVGATLISSPESWSNRNAWAPCYSAELVGTTGSGDATIAGFLMALVRGMSFEEAVRAACAVGACSVEASDAVGGILSWTDTQHRIESGWPRRLKRPSGLQWHWNEEQGYWSYSG